MEEGNQVSTSVCNLNVIEINHRCIIKDFKKIYETLFLDGHYGTETPIFSDLENRFKFNLTIDLFNKNLVIILKFLNQINLHMQYCIKLLDNYDEPWKTFHHSDIHVPLKNEVVLYVSGLHKRYFSLPNGHLVIACNIYILNPLYNPGEAIISNLMETFENMKFSDVILNVQGVEFQAHKVFLASRSSVFAAMFDSDMKESRTNQVLIKDNIGHEAFKEFLRFIYTGSVNNIDKFAAELLIISSKYLIDELKNLCEMTLASNLTYENACELLHLSYLHDAGDLKTRAIAFINNNPKTVFHSASWNEFTNANPQAVLELYYNAMDMD